MRSTLSDDIVNNNRIISVIIVRPVVNHHLHSVLGYLHVDLLYEGLGKIIEARGTYHLLIVEQYEVHACGFQVFCLGTNQVSPPKDS